MNLQSILSRIRGMKDRDGLKQIINAAESRDSKLCNIDSAKERARAYKLFAHLKAGDMVFTHQQIAGRTHSHLYGQVLTVRKLYPKNKEIGVTYGKGKDEHRLSAFTAQSLKLSTTPTSAAFSNALQERSLQPDRRIKQTRYHEWRRETDHTPRKRK